jgi:anthranilate phosphoribosyltransferase
MSNGILHKTLNTFQAGDELPSPDAELFLDALIAENDELILAELLTAWEEKGTTEDELYMLTSIMRSRCIRVNTRHETFVDLVGTGGSKAKTFNVSTCAAFVIAGAGVPVAKHGNKAATSNSGSADVLSTLGVYPAVDGMKAQECLDEIGICFMFAPNFHRLSPMLAKVRRSLGFPTIFNNLGPLCNPANAPHQVIGVWRQDLVEKTANVLARLGAKKSWVVHGSDGLDEITLNGPTRIAEIENGAVNHFEVSPQDFGLKAAEMSDVRVSTAEESAGMIRNILSGKCENATALNLVTINAAAAIYVGSPSCDLKSAFERSKESIKSGAAREKLEKLIELTNK